VSQPTKLKILYVGCSNSHSR